MAWNKMSMPHSRGLCDCHLVQASLPCVRNEKSCNKGRRATRASRITTHWLRYATDIQQIQQVLLHLQFHWHDLPLAFIQGDSSPTNMSPIPKSLDHFEMFTSCCFFSRCPCHQPTPHHPLQHLPVGSWKAVHRSTEWSRACLRQEGQLSALLRHSALHSATLCTIQISLA